MVWNFQSIDIYMILESLTGLGLINNKRKGSYSIHQSWHAKKVEPKFNGTEKTDE